MGKDEMQDGCWSTDAGLGYILLARLTVHSSLELWRSRSAASACLSFAAQEARDARETAWPRDSGFYLGLPPFASTGLWVCDAHKITFKNEFCSFLGLA